MSFSDVLFVTKHNMINAVATVSKQLEHVSEAVAVSRNGLPVLFLLSQRVLPFTWTNCAVNKEKSFKEARNCGLEIGGADGNVEAYYK